MRLTLSWATASLCVNLLRRRFSRARQKVQTTSRTCRASRVKIYLVLGSERLGTSACVGAAEHQPCFFVLVVWWCRDNSFCEIKKHNTKSSSLSQRRCDNDS